ncbi:MAG TPA: YraN family protein [Blastocatellia bacterium]|nr:YraN family protein [Blastocatellia bacterium]
MQQIARRFKRATMIPTFSTSIELGAFGEAQALAYLQQQGYAIVATNYLAPLGRSRNGRQLTGEIDIVAYDAAGCLCFIEVKTRTNVQFAAPETAVDLRKQRQIIKTGRVYRRILQLFGEPYRYDVVTVVVDEQAVEIGLLKNYFSEQRYAHSRWFRSVQYPER